MPEAPRDNTSKPNTVGQGIRRRRTALGWALKDLSQASGVPLSTLSKVETGAMSLKIEKLLDVCAALGIDVMDLVAPGERPAGEPEPVTGRRAITQSATAPETVTANAVYRHHAHDFAHRRMTPSVIHLQPGHEPELVRHRGEEFIYVLDGRVEVLTEFYTPTVLETGDSIYIDANMAHNVRALDGQPARVLNIAAARPA
ncbi:helix-turn-helix domain-containing protein [Marinihelvus fidelis]|uniref:Helix-turn-helix domain-containing protein n=1 Tax=Marinihelvus fidelis TaxID=2613842 RepID=A0A5N0T466_9GAMM|nr:XRE family transcriptional regulator [Marinihelvus fidelis]KAA9129703.1 helix-turn-helix domain-containing protein [Marinihelvus fidelis]